jgi:acyl-coenzyme A thioesterase PaaI-like protein
VDLDPHLFGVGQACFGCAPDHPTGFRLRFALEDESVVTRFTPTRHHQGPPGLMHGGLAMTLADEVGAWTLIGSLEKFGFTARFAAKLKKPLRIGHEVVARGRIAKPGARVVTVNVVLEQAEETAMEAELDFVLLDAAGAERLLGMPLPDAWRVFCR